MKELTIATILACASFYAGAAFVFNHKAPFESVQHKLDRAKVACTMTDSTPTHVSMNNEVLCENGSVYKYDESSNKL